MQLITCLKIWSNYFETMISFVCQDCLQLETFSDAKKTRITSKLISYILQITIKLASLEYKVINY